MHHRVTAKKNPLDRESHNDAGRRCHLTARSGTSGGELDGRIRARLIAKRFVKQQMRWTPQGAHLLLQVRVHVLNDELGAAFQRWYPKLSSGPEAQLAA
jgi:hypothetical protein